MLSASKSSSSCSCCMVGPAMTTLNFRQIFKHIKNTTDFIWKILWCIEKRDLNKLGTNMNIVVIVSLQLQFCTLTHTHYSVSPQKKNKTRTNWFSWKKNARQNFQKQLNWVWLKKCFHFYWQHFLPFTRCTHKIGETISNFFSIKIKLLHFQHQYQSISLTRLFNWKKNYRKFK